MDKHYRLVMGILLIILSLSLIDVTYQRDKAKETINELIELNHDKSMYIDNGCQGRYQGTEERLSK